ncbi:N-6 DNA methylase [Haloarculaceae archaeon H-GB11]|nr:N-6 DNA methylase [Haloarculaceae archaeon H-GB11]
MGNAEPGRSETTSAAANRLATELEEYLATHETVFETVTVESRADDLDDVVVSGPTHDPLVLTVPHSETLPRDRGVVDHAREVASEYGSDLFATGTETALFLHDPATVYEASRAFYAIPTDGDDLAATLRAFFEAVTYRLETGALPEQPPRDRLVALLRSFFATTWPAVEATIVRTAERGDTFENALSDWVAQNDYATLTRSEQIELAAKQYTYHLALGVISTDVFDRPPGADPVQRLESGTVDRPNVGPDFDDMPSLFELLPRSETIAESVATLLADVEATAIEDVEADVLGGIYEGLLPTVDRRALGQYYTHPLLAATLVRWAVPTSNYGDADTEIPRVLDPATGSGAFLLEAYELLRTSFPDRDAADLLDAVVGLDVNRLPLQLTALTLASRSEEPSAERLDIRHGSFFDFSPGDIANDGGDDPPADTLGTFDAVVGNPPYIRHENLAPDQEHFRSHLRRFGRDGETPYYDGSKRLSKKSDAYVYFATHATDFLVDGGRLAFVVPTKWLVSRYGQSFQTFLFDHYRLHAVVGFDARAFEDALVDTVLVLLERCTDADERAATTTKFVRLTEATSPTTFSRPYRPRRTRLLRRRRHRRPEHADPPNHLHAAITRCRQRLREARSLSLGSPSAHRTPRTPGPRSPLRPRQRRVRQQDRRERVLLPRRRHPRGVPHRGAVPHARTEESAEPGPPRRHRRRIGPLAARRPRVRPAGRSARRFRRRLLTARVERALDRDGHDALSAYLSHGRAQGYHERKSCAARPVWFDLGDLNRPEILHPKFFNDRIRVSRNADRLAPSNAVDCLSLHDDLDETLVHGILCSTVHKAALECWGRAEGGGALQLMTYELQTLPTIDPRSLSDDAAARIRTAVEALTAGDSDAQLALDRVILDALDVDLDAETLQELHDVVTQRRIQGGANAEVLLERVDRLEPTGTWRL